MSTIVSTEIPKQTLSNKRPLDTEVAPIAAKKARAAPKFLPARYNYNNNPPTIKTKKDKDGNIVVQFQNPLGNGYQVMAPHGVCKHVNLQEGGNIGRFGWCSTEATATLGYVYTNAPFPPKEGESAEDHQQRIAAFSQAQKDFLTFLKETEKKGMTQLFNSVEEVRTTFLRKAKAVMPHDTPNDKLDEMALKLMLKAAKSPIKEDNAGLFQFQVKCGAFREQNGSYTPRPVYVYDGNNINYPEHLTVSPGDIKSGAILRPVFTMRLYTTPGYKTFGTTYQMEHRFVIFNKNGSEGSVGGSAVKDESQLKQRAYQLKGVTSQKTGRYNIYVNDLNGSKYLHRVPCMRTKYCDLEDGTLGKFPGVTTRTAKYTATFIEDEKSAEYFDHVEQLVRDTATFLFNDPNVLKEQKAELRQTAKDVADETAGDIDTTMKNLFMDAIQSPIQNKGDGRELRIAGRMFKYHDESETNPQRNELKYCNEKNEPIENPSLERGCSVAPVLEPQIYILANGTAGIKMEIDMNHPIRVSEQGGFVTNGTPEKVYSADMF